MDARESAPASEIRRASRRPRSGASLPRGLIAVRIFGMIFTFPIETFAVTLIDLGVRWVRLKLTEQTTTRPTAEFVWAVLPFVKGVLNGRSRRTIPGTCGAIFARSLRRRFLSPEGV